MKSSLKYWLLGGLVTFVSVLLVLGFRPGDVDETPAWAKDGNFGWTPNPEAVKKVVDKLRFKTFAATPAGQNADPLPKEVFLWQAYQKLFNGQLPPGKNQGQIGSCVSFGTNNAIARTLAVQIALQGAAFDYKDFSEEVTYSCRVTIGHESGGEGAVGAWAAKFVQQYGIVSREKHGQYDLSEYSVATCRQFGSRGTPAELLKLAKDNPVKDITQVASWGEAKIALSQGYGIAVCSDVGFQGNRNSDGVKTPRGNWSHCMCLDAYCTINGKEYGHIENSWGLQPNEGPVGPGTPSTAGFYADSSVINRMLGAGDSWAFSTVVGWPSVNLNWNVLAPKKDDRLYAQGLRLTNGRPGPFAVFPWGHDCPYDLKGSSYEDDVVSSRPVPVRRRFAR